MTLNEKLNRYYELQEQVKELSDEMDSLKSEIISDMENEGITNQKTDEVEGKLVNKTLFKYTDEIAILKYLRDNKLDNFIQSKVNSSINKELKTKGKLYEDLKLYCSETNSTQLSVKHL